MDLVKIITNALRNLRNRAISTDFAKKLGLIFAKETTPNKFLMMNINDFSVVKKHGRRER